MTKKDYDIHNKRIYFQTAKEIFRNRRKKLINNLLTNQIFCSITKEQMLEMFATLGLKDDIRGEALSIEQVVSLSNMITKQLGDTK